jgi:hypothetical protein
MWDFPTTVIWRQAKSTAFIDLPVPHSKIPPNDRPNHHRILKIDNYPQILVLTKHRLGLYFATRRSMRKGDSPMKKALEVLLTVVALAGLYSAILTSSASPPGNSAIRAEQTVVVADGSDPMPLCRGKGCGK